MENTYDALPYTCYTRMEMHPDFLASIAAVFGLQPPPPARCRLLELGCADGTNLMGMALGLPDSQFYGVDLSQKQIEAGQQRLQTLQLENLTLECKDVLDIDKAFGEFDYITIHGIYSWVPPHVQHKILSICHDNLAPNGVVYISYNTRPGWNMRATVRDMLMFHTSQFEGIPKRVEQMRAWLNLMEKYVEKADTPYKRYLKDESKLFLGKADYYLFHEMLEENNLPEYFHEFMDKAASHQLSYVGDANVSTMFRELRSPKLFETLGNLDMIPKEQYLDFLENRPFRQTLLCRSDAQVDPEKGLKPATMKGFWFSSSLAPDNESPDILSEEIETFKNTLGEFRENLPIAKAAWLHLYEQWPAAVSFDDLYQAAHKRLYAVGEPSHPDRNDADNLAGALLRAFLSGLLRIHLLPPPCTAEPGDYPFANPLSRLQAAEGEDTVATWRNDVVQLSAPLLSILPWLDGEHNRDDLMEILRRKIDDGEVTPPPTSVNDQTLKAALDDLLQVLARYALLRDTAT